MSGWSGTLRISATWGHRLPIVDVPVTPDGEPGSMRARLTAEETAPLRPGPCTFTLTVVDATGVFGVAGESIPLAEGEVEIRW